MLLGLDVSRTNYPVLAWTKIFLVCESDVILAAFFQQSSLGQVLLNIYRLEIDLDIHRYGKKL